MRNSFLLCTKEESQLEWLQSALVSLGQVVKTEDNLEELMRLVDLMTVSLVFVSIDRQHQAHQCVLIESLLDERPMVAVIAIGDGYDSDLVISSMRAGARDFITVGQRGIEVVGLARRQLTRLPSLPQGGAQASVTVLYGAQADPDSSLVATHIALHLATDCAEVLLIDIGLPSGESEAILGIESTFFFDDALRNLRRLDSSVIESAFSRHESGLTVLCLGDEPCLLNKVNSAELFLLLGSLKQHFKKIVINLSGERDGSFVRALISASEQVLWYADQSVPGSRRNLTLLRKWRQDNVRLDHASLVVDRYSNDVAPSAETLSKTFAIPLLVTLPPSAKERLQCRNQGKNLFQSRVRSSLSKALLKLTSSLTVGNNLQRGFWEKIRGLD
ncbi:MAG: AAA family ATPase [Gammaproteobacteria bacterium]